MRDGETRRRGDAEIGDKRLASQVQLTLLDTPRSALQQNQDTRDDAEHSQPGGYS